ncbi:GAF domain-containing protein [Geodermatophilus sp. URMC 64]
MNRQPTSNSALPLADELSAVFARMSGLLLSHETAATALGLITSLAVQTVPGSAGAGVSIVDERGRRTSGATDPRTEQADALQYDLDEGPCLAATALRQVVRVDDVAEDPRWPRWGRAAAPLGLRASLSAPMVAGDRALGAVKVYAEQPAAFDPHAEHLLTLFSAQAAILVANVQSYERAQRFTAELRQAFRARDVVSIAKGVLMARHGVDEDGAVAMLLARATHDVVLLRDAARAVVDSAVRRRR